MKSKNCRVCKNRKELSEFYKHRYYKDGLAIICKTCVLEYDRQRQLNHPGPKTTGTKTCSMCKVEKSISEFTKRLRNKDGLRSCCKQCDRKCSKKWRTKNPDARYLSYVRQKYGIDEHTYKKMLVSQDYKCKICGIDGKLGIDHCHVSLRIRGLLCKKCNTGLGMFEDNGRNLKNAIKYLDEN